MPSADNEAVLFTAAYRDIQIKVSHTLRKQLEPLQVMLRDNIAEVSDKPVFMKVDANPATVLKYPQFLQNFDIPAAAMINMAMAKQKYEFLVVGFESAEGDYLAVPWCKLAEAEESKNLFNTRRDNIDIAGLKKRVIQMKAEADAKPPINGPSGFEVRLTH